MRGTSNTSTSSMASIPSLRISVVLPLPARPTTMIILPVIFTTSNVRRDVVAHQPVHETALAEITFLAAKLHIDLVLVHRKSNAPAVRQIAAVARPPHIGCHQADDDQTRNPLHFRC